MTSNKTVRVGIVGTSWWADAMYLPALQNHPDAEVVAVCGRDETRAKQFAARWNVPQYFIDGDYESLIDSGEIDAIVVSSANDSHYPITMRAIDAGLHVLCEKPLAMNYTQAKEMVTAAHEKGIKHMVPFTYRFMPTARYLKELIDSDYIGKPYHLNLRYYTGFGRDSHYLWRFDLGEAGAGVVGDIGSHFLYLARWFYGEITAVSCLLGYNVERGPRPDGHPYEQADDTAIITVEFENGAQGVIHVSSMSYEDTPFGQIHNMEFHGSRGTLHSYTDWDTVQQVSGARLGEGAVRQLPIPDHIWGNARRDTVHNTYRDVFRQQDHMTRAFISGIRDDNAEIVSPDFDDGARIQQIVEAAQRSAKENRRVEVEEIQ